jgi:capsular polysaccharide biosynthesis protein
LVNSYISAAWRWKWLVLLAAFVAGALTYAVSESRPRQYEATARLVIGPGIEAINPDLNDLRAAAQLMWTYAEYATTPAVLRKVIADFDLPIDVETLRSRISVSPDQTTLWLTIRVRSTDRYQAVLIANAIANTLVAMSPSNAQGTDQQIKKSISDQVQKLEQDLALVEARLAEDQAKLDATNVQDLQAYYQTRVDHHRTYASDLRSHLTDLYVLYQDAFTNQVTLVESPTYATQIELDTKTLVAVASVAALVASLSIVLGFEYLGRTLKRPEKSEPNSSSRRADGKDRSVPENSTAYRQGTQG